MEKFKEWIDGDLFSYRRGYILARPWLLIDKFLRHCKYAYQRVYRGWDDTASWSADYYFSKQIVEVITHLKENTVGFPCEMAEDGDWDENGIIKGHEEVCEKRWHDILDKIIAGFSIFPKMHDLSWKEKEEYEKCKKVFNEGFMLFKRYYENLWD